MSTDRPPTRPSPPSAPRVRARGEGIVIAIDGPAASGKSSTAQWVARNVGFRHVDSGSLYRAATLVALEGGRDPESWTEEDIRPRVRDIRLTPRDATFSVTRKGEPLDNAIRSADVTRHVSRVAKMPGVRRWVNEQVRSAARGHNVVVDGRDIGTAVFPDADVKIFLVADPWERARRRLTQTLGRTATDAEIARETDRLVQRDARDATQTAQAKDAILIDTTYLTQEEQVDRIVALVRAVLQLSEDSASH